MLFFSSFFPFLFLLLLCSRQRHDGTEKKVATMLRLLRGVKGSLCAEEHLGAYGQGKVWKKRDESLSRTLCKMWRRKEEQEHAGASCWSAHPGWRLWNASFRFPDELQTLLSLLQDVDGFKGRECGYTSDIGFWAFCVFYSAKKQLLLSVSSLQGSGHWRLRTRVTTPAWKRLLGGRSLQSLLSIRPSWQCQRILWFFLQLFLIDFFLVCCDVLELGLPIEGVPRRNSSEIFFVCVLCLSFFRFEVSAEFRSFVCVFALSTLWSQSLLLEVLFVCDLLGRKIFLFFFVFFFVFGEEEAKFKESLNVHRWLLGRGRRFCGIRKWDIEKNFFLFFHGVPPYPLNEQIP